MNPTIAHDMIHKKEAWITQYTGRTESPSSTHSVLKGNAQRHEHTLGPTYIQEGYWL